MEGPNQNPYKPKLRDVYVIKMNLLLVSSWALACL